MSATENPQFPGETSPNVEAAPEPPQEPDRGPEPGSDEWIVARLRELRAIVQLKKRELVYTLREGERDQSGRPLITTGELAAIDRLEQKLAARTRVHSVRLATRMRPR